MRILTACLVAIFGLSSHSLPLAADCADTTIDGQLLKLASHDPWQQQDAARRLVRHGRPAVPALVKLLADPGNDVRAWAAQAIREILAADPHAAANDHGHAYWQQRADQVKKGTPMEDVRKLLPSNGGDPGYGSGGSGQGATSSWRLDDYCIVTVYFWAGLAEHPPELERRASPVPVAFPKDFTGTWTTWHVNGQKFGEKQLLAGRVHGLGCYYADNGRKVQQIHFEHGETNGLETDWHRNGQKSAEGRYDHGKLVGAWTHWYENGQPFVNESYKAGKLDGLRTTWYPDGTTQYEIEFHRGVERGINRAWDESGKLLWDRLEKGGLEKRDATQFDK
ncbi:MAG TPA: hypothetical protein VIK18_03650 [Pirellulales bacterium]